MQRAELRQYRKRAKAQIELFTYSLGQGDRQEPVRGGGDSPPYLSSLSALTFALSPYRHRATTQILQSQDLPKLHKNYTSKLP
jgi:hypothetical protein